ASRPHHINSLLFVNHYSLFFFFFFQAEDGIRDRNVTGVQTCALPISRRSRARDRALRDAERRNGRAAYLFGRHGPFRRQLRRDAAEDGPLRVGRERRRRLPAPQRRALEHHLRESKRRPTAGATMTDVARLHADEQAPLAGGIEGV